MGQIVLPRSAWTKWVPKKTDLVPLRSPVGFAVHWPGSATKKFNNSQAAIASLLESERSFHVNTRGWTDIAYQGGVDNAGRIWDLRGISWRSAANGDASLNSRWGSITCLLGSEEEPSPEMISAVKYFRQEIWLKRYPAAKRVVGHRDLTNTDCPGPALYALVKSGEFLKDLPPVSAPPTENEDGMITRVVSVKPTGGVYVVWPGANDLLAKHVPGPWADAQDEIKAFAGGFPMLEMSTEQFESMFTVV